MKRIMSLGGVVIATAFSASLIRAAETIVRTETANVSATVNATSSLTKAIKNIVGNGAATAMNFGVVSSTGAEWSNQPGQYIQLSVDDSSLSWRLRTYTDNFASITDSTTHVATWTEQFGGMKGSIDGAKAPMGWLVNPTVLSGGPGLGDPAFGRVVSTAGVVSGNGFTYLKDRQDFDIVSTTTSVESFTVADAAGYCDIARGTTFGTRLMRPNLTAGEELLGATGDPVAQRTDPFFYYAEANFRGARGATYGTTIKLDLIER